MERLKSLIAALQPFLDHITESVMILDDQLRVVYANPITEPFLGRSRDELMGIVGYDLIATLSDVSPEPDAVGMASAVVQRMSQQFHDVGWFAIPALTMTARDGSRRTVAMRGGRVDFGALGTAIVVFADDISLRQRLDDEMRVHQKMESMVQLVSGLAHDLNNAITAVVGNVSLARLAMDGLDGRGDAAVLQQPDGLRELSEVLEQAERACAQAGSLSRQLSGFVNGRPGGRATVGLADMVRDAAALVLRGTSKTYQLKAADGLWPIVGDQSQIYQLIQNIVLNARDAVGDGAAIRVELRNRDDARPCKDLPAGRYVQCSVIDDGEGIAAVDLPRVFEPYFTTKPNGSGLGLTVAQSIATTAGGCIAIQSSLGAGTIVDVWLPAVPNPTEGDADGPGGLKVLVMDDEPAIRDVWSRMLRVMGHDCSLAANGSEALFLYQRAHRSDHPFDLVVLDLTVSGGMGARETIDRLRELDTNVVAIVCSGYADDPVLNDFLALGFSGSIAKPFTLQDISLAIRRTR